MKITEASAVGANGGRMTIVHTITVDHIPGLVLHEERTVLRVGGDEILDLLSMNIAGAVRP
ncbi:MAG: hypothetical protein JWQ43_3674 [Glaciihabitans sp.]|nr:hypothetical protein [Glaciihabitans sp.]